MRLKCSGFEGVVLMTFNERCVGYANRAKVLLWPPRCYLPFLSRRNGSVLTSRHGIMDYGTHDEPGSRPM